jgi:uncharacterized protein YyaL (SSP411 family)
VNRLGQETSPYLLQHADNPVDWYPWGDEALERARTEDKPILLSIGYSACHWCHVMEHESFEDAATAALMNERFVSIKVDREERPDVDAVYMDAVVALSGHGGWPMTVFLTPAASRSSAARTTRPSRGTGCRASGRCSSRSRTRGASGATTSRARPRRSSTRYGQQSEQRESNEPLTSQVLDDAVRALREQFDPEWGGFGRAPKFPPASTLEFLLRRGEREMTAKTLDAMALGGMYDVIGGGFHRYSVDERWLVPHFEKMLYDNALLVPAYLHGWAVTGSERYREVAEQTVDYLLRELWIDGEGFASAQDADTEGVEGLTFTWAPGEGAPDELLEPFEHGRLRPARGARRGHAQAAARHPGRAPAACARRQGDHVLERPRPRGACRSRTDARTARTCSRGRPSSPSC